MNNCCKYCLEDNKDSDHPLIYPCQCADGVHPNCLTIWLLVRPPNNDNDNCEICHVNYIGVVIPQQSPSPPPTPLIQPLSDEEEEEDIIVPPPQQINNNIDLDFICCQCHAVECCCYITGAIFGLTSSILTMQPGFEYNSNVTLPFKMFIGLCICLILMGLICTSRRYYKKCIDGRRVYDDGGV